MGGTGLAFFFEYLDVSIKDEDDVKNYTNLPLLGHVPNIKMKAEDEFSREILTYTSPKSWESEAYRNIRINVVFSFPRGQLAKTLLVTSSVPGEGKTSVLTNLGVVMAQAGKNVLLIDGDMRRSKLHKIFGLDNSVGLSNLLVGEADLDSAIQRTKVPNLSIIPSGYTPPNPADLLDSKKLVELIHDLKERFDVIFIDSTPVISPTDATILSIRVDGVILVIEAGKTTREIARRAARQLADVKAKTIGVVLNKVTTRPGDYYYYPYYREGDT
jgi:capsular exopolysaccharide synthesis family protein